MLRVKTCMVYMYRCRL